MAHWNRLTLLRWCSVAVMAITAVSSPYLLGSSELFNRLILFTGAFAVLSLAGHAVRRAHVLGQGVRGLAQPLPQLCLDMLAWAGFLYLSGGAANPLISVLLPLVAIGAMLLDRAAAWLYGGLAILIYSFLWRFHLPLPMVDPQLATYMHLLGMWLVFSMSALAMVWFIRQVILALRERDQALAQVREAAIRSDWLGSLGSFAAGTAHELSTPLATIRLLVDELRENAELASALHADVEQITRQLDRCREILDKLALRADALSLDGDESVGLSGWLHEVLERWRLFNPAQVLVESIDGELKTCQTRINPSLERALHNLLDNACRAGASQIAVDARKASAACLIRIEDNGSGISPDALQRFHMNQPAESRQGLGIGLLLGRAAIERAGGRLELASRSPLPGTVATLFLPQVEGRQ